MPVGEQAVFEGHLEPFSFSQSFLQAACLLAALALVPASAAAGNVIESRYSAHDFPLTADPAARQWRGVKGVRATADSVGKPIPGLETEFRSRWTDGYLYVLYVCPYHVLNLKPDPSTDKETDRLWEWDVAEIFVGTDFDRIGRYKEFEVSPQGEWVDLDIDHDHPKQQVGESWNSGFTVKARIDRDKKIWYAEMKIPMESIGALKPHAGQRMRVGLYRMAGVHGDRVDISWQKTGKPSFHVPESFGTLLLVK